MTATSPVSAWRSQYRPGQNKTYSQGFAPKQYTTKIWPDLTFTVGRAQPVKGDRGQHPLNGITTEMGVISFKNEVPDYDFDPEKAGQIIHDLYQAEALSLEKTVEAVENLEKKARSLMGLSGVSNSHKDGSERKKRGFGGITTYGKKMTRSSGVILEQRFGRKNLMLGTATLPALSFEELEVVCREWAEIVRKFFQALGRLLESRGLSKSYVYVTEIQEKRFDRWKQVCPHLHWVCQGRRFGGHWGVTPDEVRRLWENQLMIVLGKPVNGQAATRIENPRKSLAAEMGKYLSKGCEIIQKIVDAGKADHIPSSWWGASAKLKKAVLKAVIQDSGEMVALLVDSLDALQSASQINFRRIYWHNPDSGADVPVGVSGWWRSAECLAQFLDMFREVEEVRAA